MIEFKNVQISYGDFIAIKDLSLKINEGEFFTLLGPSGCGKTTTLRGLVGLTDLSSGSIEIRGKSMNDVSIEKRGIGVVFQNYALFPTMSVYENIIFGLKVRKESKEVIKQKVLEVCEMVDLKELHLSKNISELSGGQQQRVAIARSLILRPDILVLDEPLSNLDAALRQQLRVELKLLQKNLNITTVYVTHDQEEALTLSDRIAVFNHGVIEQVGTSVEIYNTPQTEFVANFIGQINTFSDNLLEDLKGSSLVPEDTRIASIRPENVRINYDSGKFKAVITNVDFTGFYTVIHLELLGCKFKVIEVQSNPKHEVHNEVYIDFDKDKILCY